MNSAETRVTLEINMKQIIRSANHILQISVLGAVTGVVVVFWLGVLLASGMFNLVFFLLTSLIAIGAYLVFVFMKLKAVSDLKNGNFHIVKSKCTYKHVQTESVDWSGVDTHSVYFTGYEGYKVSNYEYKGIKYGEEFFLVVINGSKKIKSIYSAKVWKLSDEFYEKDGMYYPKIESCK